jgi:hypothetical protein
VFPSPSLPVATVPLDRTGVLVGSFLLPLGGVFYVGFVAFALYVVRVLGANAA